MKEAYCFLRVVEHRLQMVNDEQTQTLPSENEGLERFARFLGFEDRDAFAKVLLGHLDSVQRYYARLFEKTPDQEKSVFVFPPDTDDHKTLDRLAALGFRAPLEASSIVRHWLSGGHRSLKGESARTHLEALLPSLLEHIAGTDNPGATLILFDHFLANLHASARLLSLLRQNPELIALIALVLGTAPRLGSTLARHPQVMDALVDPSFFGALPDETELGRRLRCSIGAISIRRRFARAHPHIWPRIYVPDWRANSFGYGYRAAGGRGFRATCGRGDPGCSPRGRRQSRLDIWASARRRDRNSCDGQARWLRDDCDFRPRSDFGLRF